MAPTHLQLCSLDGVTQGRALLSQPAPSTSSAGQPHPHSPKGSYSPPRNCPAPGSWLNSLLPREVAPAPTPGAAAQTRPVYVNIAP